MNGKCVSYKALVRSIVKVHDEIERSGGKPGAERWAIFSDDRQFVFNRVMGHYCQDVKWCPSKKYPYSENFVICEFVAYRKDSDKESVIRENASGY